MAVKVALQMDPVETINIKADSSFVMGLEALKRGYELYYYLPDELTFKNHQVTAPLKPLKLYNNADKFYEIGFAHDTNLAEMDVILMRQDPPFDMGYITATHFLEHLREHVLIVNDPLEVRNAPEKLLVTYFPELIPRTVITRSLSEAEAFFEQEGRMIMKPLYGNGGAGVFYLQEGDKNLASLHELFTQSAPEPYILQQYIPEISEGDKRIILIDGEAVGAVNRIPQKQASRANFHSGGQAGKTTLTDREMEICQRIGPTLKDKGLIFAGIDVIGPYLTEINVTSPTGIQEINRLDETKLEAKLWDVLDQKLSEKNKEA